VKESINQCSVAGVTVAGFCGLCGSKGAVLYGICVLGRLCSGLEGSVFVVGMRVWCGEAVVKECVGEQSLLRFGGCVVFE